MYHLQAYSFQNLKTLMTLADLKCLTLHVQN